MWEYPPHGLPRRSTVYCCFAARRDDGTGRAVHELLRCRVRGRAGRLEDPSPVVPDTQNVHAAVNVPATTTGRDTAKKAPGRERGPAVDVAGPVTAVGVPAPGVHGRPGRHRAAGQGRRPGPDGHGNPGRPGLQTAGCRPWQPGRRYRDRRAATAPVRPARTPLHPQIPSVPATAERPPRAHDPCEAPDPGVEPNSIEGMPSRPKHPAGRGIPTEPDLGPPTRNHK